MPNISKKLNKKKAPNRPSPKINSNSHTHKEAVKQAITLASSIDSTKIFRDSWPEKVLTSTDKIVSEIKAGWNDEITRRRDFRAVPTCTIDPIDAKDFDDALSVQSLPNGNWEIGVHIADVSFYVREESPLDQEAAKRGTSVYLVGQTIPMLPPLLSEDWCSLKPKVERLAYSAVFELDHDAKILNRWFGRTVIFSNERFSYEQAQNIIDTGKGPLAKELEILNQLGQKLEAEKIAGGAIDFRSNEVAVVIGPDKEIADIHRKEHLFTHKLVENFMLLANREVAEFATRYNHKRPNTFVYRIHDLPDLEKLQSLADFLSPLGYKLDFTNQGDKTTSAIKNLLQSVIGQPEEGFVNKATISAMSKAVYSLKNIGHYGLGFPNYTHFTSPIRRYPDLMVHRLLDYYLHQKKTTEEQLAKYSELAIRSSAMERLAMELERDSLKKAQAKFMLSQPDLPRQGIISGVIEWGIFVEDIASSAEGLIRIRDLTDDFYQFDEKRYALIGKRHKKVYRLGDQITFRIKKIDPKEGLIDLVLEK